MPDSENTTLIMPFVTLIVAGSIIPADGIASWDINHSLSESSGYMRVQLALDKFSAAPAIARDDEVSFLAGYRSEADLPVIFTGAVDRVLSSRKLEFVASGAHKLSATNILNAWRGVTPEEIARQVAAEAGIPVAEIELPATLARHVVADNKPGDVILNKIARLWNVDYTWTIDPEGFLWWVPEGNRLAQDRIPQFIYGKNIVNFEPGDGVDSRLTVPIYPYTRAGDRIDIEHPLETGRIRVRSSRYWQTEQESRTEFILEQAA